MLMEIEILRGININVSHSHFSLFPLSLAFRSKRERQGVIISHRPRMAHVNITPETQRIASIAAIVSTDARVQKSLSLTTGEEESFTF